MGFTHVSLQSVYVILPGTEWDQFYSNADTQHLFEGCLSGLIAIGIR
jgi:hypothetical protein